MSYQVDSDSVKKFANDGAILIPNLIDENWIERLRAAIDRDITQPGPFYHGYDIDGGYFHGNMRLWESDDDFRDYCCSSVLPKVSADLLGVDAVQLYYDQLFVKEAGTDAPTGWHNDQPYWPIRGQQIMSFWLALDTVNQDSGRLEFIKGSHRRNNWYQPKPFAPGGTAYEINPDYTEMPDIDNSREQYEFLSWDMKPGDVIAFHALTVHGGPANKSANRRRGYTVRYCGPGMTYYEGPGTSHFLNDQSLKHGDVIKGERYPVVWQANG